MDGLLFLIRFTKIDLLYLELKMFKNGESETSASVHLAFTSYFCVLTHSFPMYPLSTAVSHQKTIGNESVRF